ncbi:hypothetical protein P3W85_06990 [Cupriavidus basilensis]|uniref:TonB-dependent receptor n=1 Tax=Cupriavidus basilensis TaxID=68895 RepID=A0ABT6AK53_9BURK|nr:hypothetical protein [Cupriavidus basilensis]MDF3832692.1 hypothetical protein [Cupriavidus basilensis]
MFHRQPWRALTWVRRRRIAGPVRWALQQQDGFDRRYATTAYYNATQWLQGPGRRVELSVNYRF